MEPQQKQSKYKKKQAQQGGGAGDQSGSSGGGGGGGKGDWKKKKQQQKESGAAPAGDPAEHGQGDGQRTQQPRQQQSRMQQLEMMMSAVDPTLGQQQQPPPQAPQQGGQGGGKYKQKQFQKQPQDAPAEQIPTQQQHQQPQQEQQTQQQQGKGKYKQKQFQQQSQEAPVESAPFQQQQHPQQQQPQQQGKGGGKYQQKQQQKAQQQPPPQQQPMQQQRPQPSSDSPSSTHSSSPAHGALERVEENLTGMRIEKQKLGRNLRPVLTRANAYGKRGTPMQVEVNYIQLLLDKLVGVAYHYDVDVQPAASRKWQRAAFARFSAVVFPGHLFAYDGHKNAYTARRLKTDHYRQEIEVTEDNRARKFTVAMKEATVVDLSCLKTYMQGTQEANLAKPMQAIQCLDVVLRTAYENNNKFVKFQKSIYVVPSKLEDIGGNHELWLGLFQSALLGSKPFLNIDVSHKAFPSGGPILKVLADLNRGSIPDRPMTDWMCNDLHTFLKGMEISYTGPNGVAKIFKYNSLKKSAAEQTFKLENGTQMTVANYFQQQGARLKYPHLPVMHVGSLVRNILLPIEFCSIPRGQALTKKHPDICTQKIVRVAATSTDERKRKIMDLFNQIGYNNGPTIKDFGVSVGTAFENVEARCIDPPDLTYRNNQKVTPRSGVWRADNVNFIAVTPKQQLRWRILNLDSRTRPDGVRIFGENIYRHACKQNVPLEQFSMQVTYQEPRDLRSAVRELDGLLTDLKKQQMDFVIVIIPGNIDMYSKVKQKAELFTGLLTQCIKGDTIFKKNTDMSTISNIWLKINAKTNGINHVLANNHRPPLIRKRVMYVGADVTHPSPEQTNIPSVVGVAASYDFDGFRYNCCYRLQESKDEMIRDLENIVKKQLMQYKKANGEQLPELIMYYRDGVSEGQFSEILTIELNAIQSAVASMSPDALKKIPITFIVVQKRHHARFFPGRGCRSEGRNNNVPPGTIVDKYITAPNQYQFFLVSHAAVQGVAKPTKYCVLYDDANSDPDQLQAVTYALCHMFARCNRAVSYPAPTYYAHLAAFRGRVYIKDRRLDMNNLLEEYRRLQIKTEIIDGHPMFFV